MAQSMLTLRQLNRATLARQGLLELLGRVPAAGLVERLGSLQAQHPGLEQRPFGRLSAANRDALETEGQGLLPILGRGTFSRYPGTD